jgi:hypothetical protein
MSPPASANPGGDCGVAALLAMLPFLAVLAPAGWVRLSFAAGRGCSSMAEQKLPKRPRSLPSLHHIVRNAPKSKGLGVVRCSTWSTFKPCLSAHRLSPRPHSAFATANALPCLSPTARRSAPAGVDALALTTTIVSGTIPINRRQTVAQFPTQLNGPAKPNRQTIQLNDDRHIIGH